MALWDKGDLQEYKAVEVYRDPEVTRVMMVRWGPEVRKVIR